MIINFRDEKTEKLFHGEPIPKINNKLDQKARRRLELLTDVTHPSSQVLTYTPLNPLSRGDLKLGRLNHQKSFDLFWD